MFADLGLRDLIASGRPRARARCSRSALRACREMGVTRAAVPPTFPLATAERLRAAGIELYVDRELFAARRRSKTAAELRGIWRATKAAEAGLRPRPLDVRLRLATASCTDGEPLTCERAERRSCAPRSRRAAPRSATFTVADGPQTATGHGPGSGPIAAGEPVIVDLWPQDRESACFADIARTFVAGEPDPEIAAWHALVARGARDGDRRRPPRRDRPRPVERGVRLLRGDGLRHPAQARARP